MQESLSNRLAQKRGQAGIGLTEPAPRSDAVGDVLELVGGHLVIVRKNVGGDDLRMQGRDAVDRVADRDGEVCHPHHAVGDGRHAGDGRVGAAVLLLECPAEPLVDLADNLDDAGQQLRHQVFIPLFKRLRHDGVIGVGEHPGDDIVGPLPAVAAVVKQHPHHFGNGENRVGVVDLDGIELREAVEGPVGREMTVDDIPDRGRREEVLLAQPQLLALQMAVVGVKDVGDRLGHAGRAEGAEIIAAVEFLHIDPGTFGLIEPQHADRLRIIARNIEVVGDGGDCLVAGVLDTVDS